MKTEKSPSNRRLRPADATPYSEAKARVRAFLDGSGPKVKVS